MAKAKAVKASVPLTGGRFTLDQAGIIILNAEVIARRDWYAGHPTGTPRKPYNTAQRSAERTLESCKAALVRHVGEKDFTQTKMAVGYSPQYASKRRSL